MSGALPWQVHRLQEPMPAQRSPWPPDRFQSAGLLALVKLRLLDLAGAGLAKKPWLLPLKAADVCDSPFAGLLAMSVPVLLDLAGAGLAKKPWLLPLKAADVCDSPFAGLLAMSVPVLLDLAGAGWRRSLGCFHWRLQMSGALPWQVHRLQEACLLRSSPCRPTDSSLQACWPW